MALSRLNRFFTTEIIHKGVTSKSQIWNKWTTNVYILKHCKTALDIICRSSYYVMNIKSHRRHVRNNRYRLLLASYEVTFSTNKLTKHTDRLLCKLVEIKDILLVWKNHTRNKENAILLYYNYSILFLFPWTIDVPHNVTRCCCWTFSTMQLNAQGWS